MDFYDDLEYHYDPLDHIHDYERFEQNQLDLDNEGYDGDEEEGLDFSEDFVDEEL